MILIINSFSHASLRLELQQVMSCHTLLLDRNGTELREKMSLLICLPTCCPCQLLSGNRVPREFTRRNGLNVR